MKRAPEHPEAANSNQAEPTMLTAPVPTALTVLEKARAGRFVEIRYLFAPQLRRMVV